MWLVITPLSYYIVRLSPYIFFEGFTRVGGVVIKGARPEPVSLGTGKIPRIENHICGKQFRTALNINLDTADVM